MVLTKNPKVYMQATISILYSFAGMTSLYVEIMRWRWSIVFQNDWPMKGVKPYIHSGLLSEILTIANLRHAASMIWTCSEPDFRFSIDKHYTATNQSKPITSWKIIKNTIRLCKRFLPRKRNKNMQNKYNVTLDTRSGQLMA